MNEKSPADQQCRIGRCRTPLTAPCLEEAEEQTAGVLASTAAGQYSAIPRTRPALSLVLLRGLLMLQPSREVPACFGRT